MIYCHKIILTNVGCSIFYSLFFRARKLYYFILSRYRRVSPVQKNNQVWFQAQTGLLICELRIMNYDL